MPRIDHGVWCSNIHEWLIVHLSRTDHKVGVVDRMISIKYEDKAMSRIYHGV